MLSEFDLIRRYFAPLARRFPGAFDLTDDAGLITVPSGRSLVVTADAMVAGIHFLPDDPPDLVGRKLLRVNLSDLAAMGARPLAYVLTTAFSPETDESWIEHFTRGLAADQQEFDVALLGGDTTGTAGPTTLSLTALGEVKEGAALRRSAAGAGDLIYVSGTIGDAALGLKVLKNELPGLSHTHRAGLVERYRLPLPRVALGRLLAGERVASAAIDVSDGLVADLGHVVRTSGLRAHLCTADLPVSPAVAAVIGANPRLLEAALTGGDDYELLFTVDPQRTPEVAVLSDRLDLPLTCIGWLERGQGVCVLARDGREITLPSTGWTHF